MEPEGSLPCSTARQLSLFQVTSIQSTNPQTIHDPFSYYPASYEKVFQIVPEKSF
jgi:hypothetical protein